MLRTFELRLNPNREQRAALTSVLSISCELFNAALQERRDAWKICRKPISYHDQTRQITELRKCDPETASLPVDIAREPLRRVDRAFKAFFRRLEAGVKPGYPRFRSASRYHSFATSGFSINGDRLHIHKIGQIRFKTHRGPIGQPRQVVVKRTGNKWIARVVCYVGEAPARRAISSAVGIDLGLKDFVVLSDGEAIPAPKFINKHAHAIARAQKNLARKQRRSKNRLRAKEVVRRAFQRMADARKNFCHHVSKALVGRYDLIAHEDLKIAGMTHGHFAKSIMDAAWGRLLFQLSYKAESAGRHVLAVNPRGTTQRCSGCGIKVPKDLAERWHNCPHCGLLLGRDHNAALNILALGRSAVGHSGPKRVTLTHYPWKTE